MKQLKVEITQNTQAGPYMLMNLKSELLYKESKPGQFIMFQVPKPPVPLLRRPFGIHAAWSDNSNDTRGISLLYDVVGKGTTTMSELTPGKVVDVLGPLGKGFSKCKTEKAILVAGGIGIAPLRFLSETLYASKKEYRLVAGAREKDLLYIEGFDDTHEVIKTTDDGSEGIRGPVTAALEALLDEDSHSTTIYAAGPRGMLERIADLVTLYDVNCELSLEAFMACGIGACNGCAIKAIDEDGEPSYLRVCRDGPVFDSRRIISFKGEAR